MLSSANFLWKVHSISQWFNTILSGVPTSFGFQVGKISTQEWTWYKLFLCYSTGGPGSPKFTLQSAPHFSWTIIAVEEKVNHLVVLTLDACFTQQTFLKTCCKFDEPRPMTRHLFTPAPPTSITTGHKATGLKPHPLGTELPLPLASASNPPRRVRPASCFTGRCSCIKNSSFDSKGQHLVLLRSL